MAQKSIVITGSTRGIGLGLAREFLKQGCRVTLNGRTSDGVAHALEQLQSEFSTDRMTGYPGDVTDPQTHQALWDHAMTAFGRVDVWINNAGIGHPLLMVWELPVATVQQIFDINVKGLIFGAQTAIRGMLQQGFGHLYNMEGFGSNGKVRAGLSVYGTSKAAVRFLSHSLVAETQDTPVKVSTLSPGMVITAFITGQYADNPQGLEDAKKIFNILGDKVETVTPWLVAQVLSNDKSGKAINWLTTPKIITRFATARFTQRDLFSS